MSRTSESHGKARMIACRFLRLFPHLATAAVAVLMLMLEWDREGDNRQRLTLQEIRSHKLRLTELETTYFCAAALTSFPDDVAHDVNYYRGVKKQIMCCEDWCLWYRHCTGSTPEMVPDNSHVTITEEISRSIALPVRSALESYESLAFLACAGSLEQQLVLDQFRTELHSRSDIIKYVERFHPPSATESTSEHPGLTGALGALYPDRFPQWKSRWSSECP